MLLRISSSIFSFALLLSIYAFNTCDASSNPSPEPQAIPLNSNDYRNRRDLTPADLAYVRDVLKELMENQQTTPEGAIMMGQLAGLQKASIERSYAASRTVLDIATSGVQTGVENSIGALTSHAIVSGVHKVAGPIFHKFTRSAEETAMEKIDELLAKKEHLMKMMSNAADKNLKEKYADLVMVCDNQIAKILESYIEKSIPSKSQNKVSN